MPQHKTCVRCGSILPGGDSDDIEIEPPRAGRFEKLFRIAAIVRLFNRMALRAGNGFDRMFDASNTVYRGSVSSATKMYARCSELRVGALFWRAIVPGLPQWYLGDKLRAKIFFFGYCSFVIIAAVTFGMVISDFAFAFAISFHAASILNVIITSSRESATRTSVAAVMLVGALMLYVPFYLLVGNYLGRQRMEVNADTLHAGDAFLYTSQWVIIKPKVGDVVFYYVSRTRFSAAVNHTEFIIGGDLVDRVLAIENQKVTWRGGQLSVDGEPSNLLPLVALPHAMPDMEFVVPDGHCFIVPSVTFTADGRRGRLVMPINQADWQTIGNVNYRNVNGTVWAIRRSLFQFVEF
ncbi:MAG: S26 family signal peptidase [Planctomycetaceae bacterium]|jgi:hypothetical protein|nr:S26 family signal peptidase [Planctomycetaceae bacterium]